MPGRLTPLVNDQIYHIFNRGVDKHDVFLQPRDYLRFQRTFFYYQFTGPKPKFSAFQKFKLNTYKPISGSKLVDILCYCLMPNHFHFLVRQKTDRGIAKFISQLTNSYTKYVNTKYGRIGPLFQGVFKSVIVESDEQFMHLSRYIHLNPIVTGISSNLNKYQWSSYPEYVSSNIICSTKEILDMFPSKEKYKDFINDQIEFGKGLEKLKHHNFDDL